ncbi:MAG: hypothetical protein JNL87_16625 [Burkholderiaceae bacterium]|nr:hypothetical protein [Burkholderiaceae bacterium]
MLAPNARLRALVVPQGPDVEEQATEAAVASECGAETVQDQSRSHRISWARLLERVFDVDMQHCPNCGSGELKIIVAILERPVIEKILTPRHFGPPQDRRRTAAGPSQVDPEGV